MDRNAAPAKITAAQARSRAPGDHFLTARTSTHVRGAGHRAPRTSEGEGEPTLRHGGPRRYEPDHSLRKNFLTRRGGRSVGPGGPGRAGLQREGPPPEVLERLPADDRPHGLPDPLDELLRFLGGGESEFHGHENGLLHGRRS